MNLIKQQIKQCKKKKNPQNKLQNHTQLKWINFFIIFNKQSKKKKNRWKTREYCDYFFSLHLLLLWFIYFFIFSPRVSYFCAWCTWPHKKNKACALSCCSSSFSDSYYNPVVVTRLMNITTNRDGIASF